MSTNRFNPLDGTVRAAMEAPTSAPTSAPGPATPKASDQMPRPAAKKRKGHRGGKKKRSRRKSFALLHEDSHDELDSNSGNGFYQAASSNVSGTSLDSEALLDHRWETFCRSGSSNASYI